jgi:predicted nucleic acid-binding protein
VIVVDSNVIAYCWLNSPMTGLAQRVRVKDPDWQVPVLWRSEMRSILTGYLRDGSLSAAQARRVMRQVEEALAGCEHLVSSDAVLKVIDATRLSAYDAEFIALADELSVPLVTEDKAVLKAFPEAALSMEGFLACLRHSEADRHESGFSASPGVESLAEAVVNRQHLEVTTRRPCSRRVRAGVS